MTLEDAQEFCEKYKKAHGCRTCPTHVNLQLHHINPLEKQGLVEHIMAARGFDAGLAELNRCYTLCVYCHTKLHGARHGKLGDELRKIAVELYSLLQVEFHKARNCLLTGTLSTQQHQHQSMLCALAGCQLMQMTGNMIKSFPDEKYRAYQLKQFVKGDSIFQKAFIVWKGTLTRKHREKGRLSWYKM
mgnify:CR=1 FL=1